MKRYMKLPIKFVTKRKNTHIYDYMIKVNVLVYMTLEALEERIKTKGKFLTKKLTMQTKEDSELILRTPKPHI